MTIAAPLDPREYAYGIFGDFDVPDDGDFYLIRSEWLVYRVSAWATPGALGSLQLAGAGGLIGIGSATSDTCVELNPNYLYRAGVTVHHNAGTGGTLRVRIEYAWHVSRSGSSPPIVVTT